MPLFTAIYLHYIALHFTAVFLECRKTEIAMNQCEHKANICNPRQE